MKRKRSKKIFFVRHGQSEWNVVFNLPPLQPPTIFGRLALALVEETRLLPTMDSVFVDSPLSVLGTDQAKELQSFVDSHPILNGSEGRSVLASSNLRRALSTGTIGFWNRLNKKQSEKIRILSCLQEITFNVDGVALAKPETAPVLAAAELRALKQTRTGFNYSRFYDASENNGDKIVRGKGLTRMLEFCQWAFRQTEENIIVNGHSLYFRFFFQTFLPYASRSDCKLSKMGNGAVASFTLWEGEDGSFVIDDDVTILHGHLESAKKSK